MSKKLTLGLSIVLSVVISFLLVVSPASAETYKVKMGTNGGMLRFDPSNLSIKVGDTVEWVNNKLSPHNVVFDPAKTPAGVATKISHKNLLFSPGESFKTTFNTAGTYSYYCEPHRGAGMVAKILVQ